MERLLTTLQRRLPNFNHELGYFIIDGMAERLDEVDPPEDQQTQKGGYSSEWYGNIYPPIFRNLPTPFDAANSTEDNFLSLWMESTSYAETFGKRATVRRGASITRFYAREAHQRFLHEGVSFSPRLAKREKDISVIYAMEFFLNVMIPGDFITSGLLGMSVGTAFFEAGHDGKILTDMGEFIISIDPDGTLAQIRQAFNPLPPEMIGDICPVFLCGLGLLTRNIKTENYKEGGVDFVKVLSTALPPDPR